MGNQKLLNLEQALKELKDLIHALHAVPFSDDESMGDNIKEPAFYFSRVNYGGVALDGEGFRNYRRILDAFCAITDRTLISRKAIDRKLQEVILKSLDVNAVEDERSLEKRRKALFKSLQSYISSDSAKKGNVYISVAGLDVTVLPMSFGGVTFQLFDKESLKEHKKQFKKLAAKKEYITIHLASLKREVEKNLKGKVVAIVPTTAIDNEARTLQALLQLRTVVDAVNFYGDLLYRPGWSQVSIFSHIASAIEHIFALIEPANYAYTPQRVGRQQDFSIKELLEGRGKALESVRVHTLLAKPNRNSMEERVITAIRWAGRATVAQKPEEAFLSYAIALESALLEKGKSEQIVKRLQIRGAFILSSKTEYLEANSSEIGRLYDIRSRIAHEGSFEVSDVDLRIMRDYIKEIIFRIMAQEPFVSMQREEEFFTWLNKNAPIPADSKRQV